MPPLRDASQLLYPAVQETLGALGLLKPEAGSADAAAAKLAQQYARSIDAQNGHCRGCDDPECGRAQTSAWAMRWLGPLLHSLLGDLGATPAGRAAMSKGSKSKPGDDKPNRLHGIRSARGA